jgi:hypothetical protein
MAAAERLVEIERGTAMLDARCSMLELIGGVPLPQLDEAWHGPCEYCGMGKQVPGEDSRPASSSTAR